MDQLITLLAAFDDALTAFISESKLPSLVLLFAVVFALFWLFGSRRSADGATGDYGDYDGGCDGGDGGD
ncbi:hypothetical protein [Litorisediminicola beolgyonensis]|uniref:Uncharacterized protein n=1 Tax=Litorisediminicola beolgyonensis TaxID=1173614 RepID=A0ABW3ZKJ8_9RHOB